MARVYCAVLAGGVSLRFGGWKLAARLGGEPLLARVAAALEASGECGRVAVATSRLALPVVESILSGSYDVVVDEAWLPCTGPLRGIAAAAIAAPRGWGLAFAAGDMAWLGPGNFARLVRTALEEGATAAAPLWGDGYVQTLTGYLADPWEAVAACLRRGPRGRPSDIYRAAREPLLAGTRLLGDESGLAFATVNTPGDLAEPEPAPPGGGLLRPRAAAEAHREALRLEAAGGPHAAALYYRLEAEEYARLGVRHFALHAWQDYCDSTLPVHSEASASRSPLGGPCRGRTRR